MLYIRNMYTVKEQTIFPNEDSHSLDGDTFLIFLVIY